jgi:hypothetical protein
MMHSLVRVSSRVLLSSAAVAAILASAACASMAPVAQVSGRLQTRTAIDLAPVQIVSIDGQSRLVDPYSVEPGLRVIVLQAPPARGQRVGPEMTMQLTIQPCTRYYLAARRGSPLLSAWDPIVERTEPLAPCGAGRTPAG